MPLVILDPGVEAGGSAFQLLQRLLVQLFARLLLLVDLGFEGTFLRIDDRKIVGAQLHPLDMAGLSHDYPQVVRWIADYKKEKMIRDTVRIKD